MRCAHRVITIVVAYTIPCLTSLPKLELPQFTKLSTTSGIWADFHYVLKFSNIISSEKKNLKMTFVALCFGSKENITF